MYVAAWDENALGIMEDRRHKAESMRQFRPGYHAVKKLLMSHFLGKSMMSRSAHDTHVAQS